MADNKAAEIPLISFTKCMMVGDQPITMFCYIYSIELYIISNQGRTIVRSTNPVIKINVPF